MFAYIAETDASFDPNLKSIVEAPLLAARELEMLSGAEEKSADHASPTMPIEDPSRFQPGIRPVHQPIDARALTYATRVHDWLGVCTGPGQRNTNEPFAVIASFGLLIALKVRRALSVWSSDDAEEQDWSSDQDGSAKVALIAMEQSHAAWRDLVEHGVASQDEAQPFIEELVWLHEALEQVRPNARRFVRPAFDEPDEVARLLAAE